MAYNLPELDRMSKALSRLETALLTHRFPISGTQNASQLEMENQKLCFECETLKKQLYNAQEVLSEILDTPSHEDVLLEATENQLGQE